MIQKLRRRLTALVIVSLMLIAVGIVLAINYANMQNIRNQMYETLETLMENEGQRPGASADDSRREETAPPEQAEGTPPPLPENPQAEDAQARQTDETPPPIPENPQEMQPGGAQPEKDRPGQPGQPDRAALASLSNSYSVWLDEDGEVEEWTSDREDLYSDDQNAPKDMSSRIDIKKLLEDGVIDEDTYNAIEAYLKENASEKPEGEQKNIQQPPEKPEGEQDDTQKPESEQSDGDTEKPELPEIGDGLDEVQLKSLLDAGVITQEQYDTLLELLTGSGDAA